MPILVARLCSRCFRAANREPRAAGHREIPFPSMRIWPGRPAPLGATFDGVGVNFSVFSERAERVELCLFDAQGRETRVDLPERTALCWHGYLPDVKPGRRYGFRVHGPWAPDDGR